ncbi:hypothetical protein AXF42_Ash000158 [Apostasia shenzhenica]|uniref:Cytochrome b6-f complex subunit 7 n=1 Tax=Apostasia shenzhenica TaxID=1088818 RepID=A0A2I0AFM5_9ASPA|nr:hypothetical protein AXF42_Ash000158 [Apostasia shenzhenica]
MAAISPASFPAAAISTARKSGVVRVEGLNSYGGLKAHTRVSSLGAPRCADRSFAVVMSCIKPSSMGKKSRGGALSSTCSAAAEIFKIAAIMNGLVLVGVAVGFVLLRVEASLEESE